MRCCRCCTPEAGSCCSPASALACWLRRRRLWYMQHYYQLWSYLYDYLKNWWWSLTSRHITWWLSVPFHFSPRTTSDLQLTDWLTSYSICCVSALLLNGEYSCGSKQDIRVLYIHIYICKLKERTKIVYNQLFAFALSFEILYLVRPPKLLVLPLRVGTYLQWIQNAVIDTN